MASAKDLEKEIDKILGQSWNNRDGKVVPISDEVALADGAVKLTATMLYADLADSTELAIKYDRKIAAKVYKSFLTCASRLIKEDGGDIRSFDGDRVMGVFIGNRKNSSAAICALKINYAFLHIIRPKLEAKYAVLKNGSYKLAHSVGIDTSEMLVIRGGVRNHNDLVWIGRAPNVAAKLSAIRESPYHSFITETVFKSLAEDAKFQGQSKVPMWEKRNWSNVQGINTIYRSSWTWKP